MPGELFPAARRMKRPGSWFHAIVATCLGVLIFDYLALAWVVPQFVKRQIRAVSGGGVLVDSAEASFPLTVTVGRLRLAENTDESALTVQQAVIHPEWVSFSSRTVGIESIELEQPFLRVTKRASGDWQLPPLPPRWYPSALSFDFNFSTPSVMTSAVALPWRLRVDSIRILDGTIEFIDEQSEQPFHGLLEHVSLTVGPMTVPLEVPQVSFAVRGELIGSGGHAAPLYCSGWFDQAAHDLDASCRLEPLALAAFEPYYRQFPVTWLYSVTLSSTSQWIARANDLEARIQLELSDLSRGDFSVRGHTILDVKRSAEGEEPQLKGELTLQGPLDQPQNWHASFVPGNELVQQVVERLLDRGIEFVKLPIQGQQVGVSIAPASEAAMRDIEIMSQETSHALSIFVEPKTGVGNEQVVTPSETSVSPAGSNHGGDGVEGGQETFDMTPTESRRLAPVTTPIRVTPDVAQPQATSPSAIDHASQDQRVDEAQPSDPL